MDSIKEELKAPLAQLLLSIADDKLFQGHHDADWTGLGPILEEDIAFSSMAQDEISHALALYQVAGNLVHAKPDKLAYGRAPEEYRCAEICESSDDFNWATAMVRKFLCDHFDFLRLKRLAKSIYTPLAHLCQRLAAEEEAHVKHADDWMIRLGKGSDEARKKLQEAVDRLKPLAPMLFEKVEGEDRLESEGVYPPIDEGMFETWRRELVMIAEEAGITLRLDPPVANTKGGRKGRHSPAFAEVLDEMTEVYRVEPEAAW